MENEMKILLLFFFHSENLIFSSRELHFDGFCRDEDATMEVLCDEEIKGGN